MAKKNKTQTAVKDTTRVKKNVAQNRQETMQKNKSKKIIAYQASNNTQERETVLAKMSNQEIDLIIAAIPRGSKQEESLIYFNSFKKMPPITSTRHMKTKRKAR